MDTNTNEQAAPSATPDKINLRELALKAAARKRNTKGAFGKPKGRPANKGGSL